MSKPVTRGRPRTTATFAAVAGGALLASIAIAPAANAAQAVSHPGFSHSSTGRFGYGALAFGSSVQIGDLVNSGRTALNSLGCTRRSGLFQTGHTASANLGALGHVGAVNAWATTRKLAGVPRSASHARTAGFSLFDGLLKASVLKSTATVMSENGRLRPSGTAGVLGLTLAGNAISLPTKPNSTIALPGIGSLTFDALHVDRAPGLVSATVNALQIKVTALDLPGARPGTIINLGNSVARLGKASKLLQGEAYGTDIDVAGVIDSSPTFRQPLGCLGTDQQVNANDGVGLNSSLIKTGVIADTAKGETSKVVSGVTRSSIADVAVLGKLIKAHLIVAEAHVHGTTPTSLSTSGSQIVGLVIAGERFAGPIKPNTTLNLGVGTVVLDHVVRQHRRIAVHMITLTLSKQLGKLAKGTVVEIGNASAGLRH